MCLCTCMHTCEHTTCMPKAFQGQELVTELSKLEMSRAMGFLVVVWELNWVLYMKLYATLYTNHLSSLQPFLWSFKNKSHGKHWDRNLNEFPSSILIVSIFSHFKPGDKDKEGYCFNSVPSLSRNNACICRNQNKNSVYGKGSIRFYPSVTYGRHGMTIKLTNL